LTQVVFETQSTKYKTACWGILKNPANYPSAAYHGERIFFCARACLRVFEQNPDSFMAGAVKHPLEEDDG